MKVKYTLLEILEAHKNGELDDNDIFYTRKILSFMRDITIKEIIEKNKDVSLTI